MKTTPLPAALIAALSVSLLASCAPTIDEAELAPTSPIIEPRTPTEEPTEAPDEEVVEYEEFPAAGEVLTAEQADELNKFITKPVKAYPMADGSYIAVDRDQPLPAVVAAQVALDFSEITRAVGETDETYFGVNGAIRDFEQKYGRKVIVVMPVMVYCTAQSDTRTPAWTTVTTATTTGCQTRNEALASAEAHVAGQADPAKWEIVVGG